MEIEVNVAEAKIGQFVTRLDVPWEQTNFALQGFLITANAQINELHRCNCKVFYCESERSVPGTLSIPKFNFQEPDSPEEVETQSNRQSFTQDVVGVFLSPVFFATGMISDAFKAIFPAKIQPQSKFVPKPVDPKINKAIDSIRVKDSARIRKTFGGNSNVPQQIILHAETESIVSEVPKAQRIKSDLSKKLPDLINDMSSSNLSSQLDTSKGAVNEVVSSIIRNPGAMQLINGMKAADLKAHQQALDVSLTMICFGRELCMPHEVLVDLGIGGLFLDIGYTTLLHGLFRKRTPMNAAELKIAKNHVKDGLSILESSGITNPIVVEMVSNHHERYDGSGFPSGLHGDDIGMYGHMAAITAAYVALVSGEGGRKPMTPSKAIGVMLKEAGKAFHPTLIHQFVRVVGIYPIGSLVQVSSGEIGIVIQEHKMWRLRPTIKLVLNKDRLRLKDQKVIELISPENSEVHVVSELGLKDCPKITDKDFLLE